MSLSLHTIFIWFITLCPLFIWIGRDMRQSQEMFYQLAGTVLVLFAFLIKGTKQIKVNKFSICFGVFGIYSVLLFMLGGGVVGASTMLNIFLSAMLYFITLQLRKEDTGAYLKTIILVAVFNIAYMGLQSVGYDFVFAMKGMNNTIDHTGRDLIGFFGIKSSMGIFMGLAMIAMFTINPYLALLFLVPIYISKSSGAVLGVAVASLFYFYHLKRKVFKVLLPICLAGLVGYMVFIDSPMGMMGSRPPMWKMAMKDVVYGYNLKEQMVQSPYLRNVLTGFGLDAFLNGNIMYFKESDTDNTVRGIRINNNVYSDDGQPFLMDDKGNVYHPNKHRLDRWDDPHLLLVTIIYNWGLIGLLIIGFGCYYLWQMFKHSLKTKELVTVMSMILVILLSSTTQFPLCLARIGYIMPVLLGLVVINSDSEREYA